MKKEYNIKDTVWIHMGEQAMVEGRVVEIFDLAHLNEGHSPKRELYVIEIKTGIDDIYEVRDFDQISPTGTGPINLFANHKQVRENNRYLKKVGMKLPIELENPLVEIAKEINNEVYLDDVDPADPTPEQIHAALDRAERSKTTIFNPGATNKKPAKKRQFTKRPKKNDSVNS